MPPLAAPSGTRDPALAIAARSLLEHGTLTATFDQVVSRSAFDHHRHGLFQYAALRVGVPRGAQLLTLLSNTRPRDEGDSTSSASHASSALYHAMRELLRVDLHGDFEQRALLPDSSHYWWSRDRDHNATLRQLRQAMCGLSAEIAELHLARGLDLATAAHMVGVAVPDAMQQLTQALALAQRTGGARPKSHDRSAQGLLAETFLLDPRLTPQRSYRQPIVRSGDVVANRYEIDELLGSGAFADVYRAHDRDVEGHVVALKITRAQHHDQSSMLRGLRELQLIASVFHPSVVQLKDHGWHHGHLWFVMPLYRGETLSQRMQRGPLQRAEARAIFVPLAEALATMHRAGVMHQDIKPDNIFLADIDPDEQRSETSHPQHAARRVLPILLDLGVAAKDAEVVLAGTLAYLAPEVAARFAAMPDPAPVGPKADVFSLALTLRDALDPQATIDAPLSSVDAFLSHRAVTAPAPPQDAALSDLRKPFARWLHASPDARPTATELCHELQLLTLPNERRARRLATLRWAFPTALALLSLFGVVVYALSQEASLQRTQAQLARGDAERASQRAASIHADLAKQQARRKELEANIAELSRDYRQSRLTREQLMSHLELRDAQIAALEDRFARMEQRSSEREAQLVALNATREQLTSALEATQQARDNSERQLERLRERHSHELQATEQRREQLEARLSAMEVALEQSRSALARLRQASAASAANTTSATRPLAP